MKTGKVVFASVCFGVVLALLSSVGRCQTTNAPASAQAEQNGTLEIDGQGVERLNLLDSRGQSKVLDSPGRTVSLPPGTYSVVAVNVQKEFQASYPATDKDRFTLTPGRSHRLRAGQPLTPSVRVSRRGRALQLDYKLTDADGRSYTSTGSERAAPHYTIYSGEEEVDSGDFQYG